eukprot:EG_transcript_35250
MAFVLLACCQPIELRSRDFLDPWPKWQLSVGVQDFPCSLAVGCIGRRLPPTRQWRGSLTPTGLGRSTTSRRPPGSQSSTPCSRTGVRDPHSPPTGPPCKDQEARKGTCLL